MPRATLRITEEFQYGLAEIYSERLLERIRQVLENLQEFPDMGSSEARPSLARRFGPSIRTLPISMFVLAYRHVGDYVDILALVPGPAVE